MAQQRTTVGSPNALRRPFEITVSVGSDAPPTAVYELLADPAAHLDWAGERRTSTSRLLTMDAPAGPLVVGDEFSTTGADPMGAFLDRSVVTEATSPEAFAFVTEAALTTKDGRTSVWTNVHRYEIDQDGRGSRVTYSLRVARVSELRGMLRIFNWPLVSSLAIRVSAGPAKAGITNLSAMAEERSVA